MKNKQLVLLAISSYIWMIFLFVGIFIFLYQFPAIVWMGFIFVMLVLLLFPFPTVEITQPMKILNKKKTVKPGKVVKFQLDYRKVKHYKNRVILSLVCKNGWVYFFNEMPESLPLGEFRGKNSLVSDYNIIPKEAPETSCHLVLDSVIDLGFMGRKKSQLLISEDFIIKR